MQYYLSLCMITIVGITTFTDIEWLHLNDLMPRWKIKPTEQKTDAQRPENWCGITKRIFINRPFITTIKSYYLIIYEVDGGKMWAISALSSSGDKIWRRNISVDFCHAIRRRLSLSQDKKVIILMVLITNCPQVDTIWHLGDPYPLLYLSSTRIRYL